MIWAAAAEFKVLWMHPNTQTYLSVWEIQYWSYAVKYKPQTTIDRSMFYLLMINLQWLYGHKIIFNIDNNCIYSLHLCNSVKWGHSQRYRRSNSGTTVPPAAPEKKLQEHEKQKSTKPSEPLDSWSADYSCSYFCWTFWVNLGRCLV